MFQDNILRQVSRGYFERGQQRILCARSSTALTAEEGYGGRAGSLSLALRGGKAGGTESSVEVSSSNGSVSSSIGE